MRYRAKRRVQAAINVVPYIDVMLVLLVVFVAVSPFVETREVHLPLFPNAAISEFRPLEIQVLQASSGASFSVLDHETGRRWRDVSMGDLRQVVQHRRSSSSNALSILLSADESVSYSQVMQVFSDLQQMDRVQVILAVRDI